MWVTLSGTTPVEAPTPAIGEEEDLTILGEAVNERRVPVVEVAAKVLQTQQRRRVGVSIAETAVNQRVSADFDRAILSSQLAPGVGPGRRRARFDFRRAHLILLVGGLA